MRNIRPSAYDRFLNSGDGDIRGALERAKVYHLNESFLARIRTSPEVTGSRAVLPLPWPTIVFDSDDVIVEAPNTKIYGLMIQERGPAQYVFWAWIGKIAEQTSEVRAIKSDDVFYGAIRGLASCVCTGLSVDGVRIGKKNQPRPTFLVSSFDQQAAI